MENLGSGSRMKKIRIRDKHWCHASSLSAQDMIIMSLGTVVIQICMKSFEKKYYFRLSLHRRSHLQPASVRQVLVFISLFYFCVR